MIQQSCVCPHCGYDLTKDELIEDGDFRYVPGVGLFWRGNAVKLPPAQTLIVGALIKARGRLLTRNALLGVIGSEDCLDGIVNVQVSLLRQNLRKRGIPETIHTVWGTGYRWDASQAYKPVHGGRTRAPRVRIAA